MHDSTAIQELRRLIPQCLLPDQIRLGHALLRARERQAAGAHGAPPFDRWLAEARASIQTRQRRAALLPQVAYPEDLPITARKDEIVAAIRAHRVVVVAGETGSGKTTQLPEDVPRGRARDCAPASAAPNRGASPRSRSPAGVAEELERRAGAARSAARSGSPTTPGPRPASR